MPKHVDFGLAALLRFLSDDPSARLVDAGDRYRFAAAGGTRPARISRAHVAELLAKGLIAETGPGSFAASETARAWLKRRDNADRGFRAQHHTLAVTRVPGEDGDVLTNLDESPIAALARRPGKNGMSFLSPDLVAAAERLRRDFEVGRLQPRVTANWSASVNRGRRTGGSSGLTDLTDMALAARLRVDRAIEATGPELSGVLIDVCCFLKGLETVERERQWPARSAKLVLRIALQGLARHYGLTPAATGQANNGKLRHWGAGDFRPAIT